VVAQLQENGSVKRGWLGVRIQPVTPEIAESLGLDKPEGAMVASVNTGSPAEKAGLHQGDVILSFAGEKIEHLRDLTRAAADAEVGSNARLDVWRGEKAMTLDVRMGEAPQQLASATGDDNSGNSGNDGIELNSLGLVLANLDDQTRARYGLDDTMKGVVIAGVASNSDAADKGLRPGDLITRINQKTVATPTDITQAVEQAEQAKRKAVLLLVERQGEERFVAVEIAHA
jgi:serine protease Do